MIMKNSFPKSPSFACSHPRLQRLACTLAGLALITSAAAQTTYTITDLGTLPGADHVSAYGLNDQGDVVGWSGSATLTTGFIWNGGVMRSIGSLPGGNPGSLLFAINGLGQAAGVANPGNFKGSLQYQGILFRNNAMQTIDTGAQSLFAHFISDAGVIVGDYTKGGGSSGSVFQPAFWKEMPAKPGQFRRTNLFPALGDTAAYANAANQSLIIVGTTISQARGNQACIWNNDARHSPKAMAPAPGDQTAIAKAVNGLGAACGFSWFGIYRTTPVVWSADASHTPTALPTLPGTVHGNATGINNSGEVIGFSGDGSSAGGATGATPVIWLNGQIYALQSLLDASGAGWDLTGIVAGQGFAINNAGQIIGNAMHNGVPRAFIMTRN
jgi:probable HAF family extracellular repeat protein